MNEENGYYKKSETSAPQMVFDHEPSTATQYGTNAMESDVNTRSTDALINQDIIKTDDYRKNKASRKVIAHVPFKPD